MLTVGDDELTVGDNDNVLSEVAKGGAHAGVPGNSYRWAMCNPASQVQSTGILGEHRNKNMT